VNTAILRTLVVCLLLGSAAAGAAITEATAPSAAQAEAQARRMAVEQALEDLLRREGLKRAQVDLGAILGGEPERFVTRSETRTRDVDIITGKARVTVDTEVDTYRLDEALQDWLQARAAGQAKRSEAMLGQSTVTVRYGRRGPDSPRPDSRTAQALVAAVEDTLSEHGLRVRLADQVERIRTWVTETMLDEETALAVAHAEKADVVVFAFLDVSERPIPGERKVLRADILLKAFDATTGAAFANPRASDEAIARGTRASAAGVAARLAAEVGREAAQRGVRLILRRLANRERSVLLVLREVDRDTQRQVTDLLAAQGWHTRIDQQAGRYLAIEVLDEGDAARVRRAVQRGAYTLRLPLYAAELKGQRVVFEGE
jgi:hypothetical protein